MGFLVSLFMILFLRVIASVAPSRTHCDNSGYFDCGNLRNISYPFWKDGQNQVNCGNEEYKLWNCDREEFPSISVYQQMFLVKNISQESNRMRLSLPNGTFPLVNPCVQNESPLNMTMNSELRRRVVSSSTVYVLWGCDSLKVLPVNARRCGCGQYGLVYWGMDKDLLRIASSCKMHIEVAVTTGPLLRHLKFAENNQELWTHLQKAFDDGFEVSFRQPQKIKFLPVIFSGDTIILENNLQLVFRKSPT